MSFQKLNQIPFRTDNGVGTDGPACKYIFLFRKWTTTLDGRKENNMQPKFLTFLQCSFDKNWESMPINYLSPQQQFIIVRMSP